MNGPLPRRGKPHQVKGVQFTVWAINGGPIPPEIVEKIEKEIEKIVFEAFNEGLRILTQTTHG